jgi:hypothetical protein
VIAILEDPHFCVTSFGKGDGLGDCVNCVNNYLCELCDWFYVNLVNSVTG